MAAVPVLLMAASAAVAATGAVYSAQAQSAAYDAQARAQDYQADRDREAAAIAWQQAGAREDAQRQRARRILAGNRAALAQSGYDPSTGSAALLQEQDAANAELDALMVRYEGDLQARGLNIQSDLDRYGGDLSRMNARSTRTAGMLSGAGQLLQGASGAYGTSQRLAMKPGGGT